MSFLQLIDRENQYMIMKAKRKNYLNEKKELVRILLIDSAICLFTV